MGARPFLSLAAAAADDSEASFRFIVFEAGLGAVVNIFSLTFLLAANPPTKANRALRMLEDLLAARDAARFLQHLSVEPPRADPQRGNALLERMLDAWPRWDHYWSSSVCLRCVDAILRVFGAAPEALPHAHDRPTLLVRVLAHGAIQVLERLTQNERVAECQYLLSGGPVYAVARHPADGVPAATLPALFWDPQLRRVLAKLRVVKLADACPQPLADDLLRRAVDYVVEAWRHPRAVMDYGEPPDAEPDFRWREWEGGLAIVRLVMERWGGAPAALRLPTRFPPLDALLRAAAAEARRRTLALAMAFHPRLGAASPLGALDAELLRTHLAPRVGVMAPDDDDDYALALRRRLWFHCRGWGSCFFYEGAWNDEYGVDVFTPRPGRHGLHALYAACVRRRRPVTPKLLSEFERRWWCATHPRELRRLHRTRGRRWVSRLAVVASRRRWPDVLRRCAFAAMVR